ncbi:PREDICTED: sodium-dependent lysophosphatidylcholine symporter 1-A-like [Branchiostoma belcheri]|uniref:Sodium-dependent lysophosphatidylcholine symporter 1-A-like n=1 Tax=Branchiostoma belcheri TaxID=7741 RepID=A0A6P5ABX3_BRABE|nr:PREDICTED: sodium-dependent lysophosphatidylcholine symporter 1-A-like [Branchiostoma belcheri]
MSTEEEEEEEERKPLSVVSKLCYGLGGMAVDTFWTVLGAYTNIFLVEVAQLPPLFGTSVVFGGRAIDAACNFIIGPLINRTDTRWGKIKPWILGSGLLLMPIYILVWYVPEVGLEGKLAWYILLYVLLMFVKTALSISSRALVVFLSHNSQDRDSATVYRGLFVLLGIVAGMAIHGQIVALYEQAQFDPCTNSTNSTNSTMDNSSLAEVKTGYLISAGVIAGLTLVCVLGLLIGTTERKDISNTSQQQHSQSFIMMIKSVLTFRPNVFLLLIFTNVSLTLAILLGTSVLYIQYKLDLADQVQNAMLAFVLSAAVSMVLMAKVVAKLGKRISFMCYQLVMLIGVALNITFFLILCRIGGYKTGECVQPASVGTSLEILVSVFPAVCSLLAVVLIWRYPITEQRREEVQKQLENRKKPERDNQVPDSELTELGKDQQRWYSSGTTESSSEDKTPPLSVDQ